MPKRIAKEVDRLKKTLMVQSSLLEERLRQAIKAVMEGDVKLARQIIDNDNEIDKLKADLEEECLKLLALQQPEAMDLRHMVSLLKINNHLEHIGDLCVSIAEDAIYLAEED